MKNYDPDKSNEKLKKGDEKLKKKTRSFSYPGQIEIKKFDQTCAAIHKVNSSQSHDLTFQ